ncbi:MAG: ArsA family ATPase [Acidimicrobiales bacterium]
MSGLQPGDPDRRHSDLRDPDRRHPDLRDPDRRVLVWLGAGGVGKTTMAAAGAVASARAGERVVVLTIDPARRLGDALGLGGGAARRLGGGAALANEPRLVEGPWPGELWAAVLDPAETLQRLVKTHGEADQVARLLDNRLFAAITNTLGGTSEYMAAERLHQLHRDPRFDRVVIDTPPSRHAIDFLDSPTRLANFVDNRFYQAIFTPRRGVLRSVNAAAQVVLRLVGRVVGSDLVDDVTGLFRDLEGLDRGFRDRAVETAELLAGPDCRYVIVTSPRRQPIREAGWIADNLERRHRLVDAVVVNRLTPYGRDPSIRPSGARGTDRDALDANLAELRQLAVAEDELIEASVRPLVNGRLMVTVEDRGHAVASIDELLVLADALRRLMATV